MKKGPLSKKEKSYIVENYHNTTATIMADKLGRSVHMVDKFIAKQDFQQTTSPEKPEEPVQESKPDNPLYARNVAENGVVRSTIGTQAASMAADESRAKRKSPDVSPRYSQHIHQIKPKN
jgi:hypothetical protein